MKQNENSQKISHERVTKTNRKNGKKRKQHPQLVPAIVIESKPLSKVNTVGKIENLDLYSKPKKNIAFCFRYPKRTPQIKRK